MDTKLTDIVYIDKQTFLNEHKQPWVDFFDDKPSAIDPIFEKTKPLMDERWVKMEGKLLYDHKIKACWYAIGTPKKRLESGTKLATVLKYINTEDTDYLFDIPTGNELVESLTKLSSFPFSLSNKSPYHFKYTLYKDNQKVQGFDMDVGYLKDSGDGVPLPIFRLTQEDRFDLNYKETLFRWVALGLVPEVLKDDEAYAALVESVQHFEIRNFFEIGDPKENIKLSASKLKQVLLEEDKLRANLAPYHAKMLTDTNLGHWSLWDAEKAEDKVRFIRAKLNEKLVARNPVSSVVNGVVGIDFGTKSTVVVYQKETTKIHPMRIGTGDLAKRMEASHYENPTIMEFNHIEQFKEDYERRAGRPYTKWEDLTISHTAFGAMLNSPSEFFDAYVSELKQWAGDKKRKLKIVDKQQKVLDLPPFLEIEEELNPIELYAYYLGLYINNQNENRGIFMDYILSFPVTYEVEIRDKIIESFKKGLLKSLPQELHDQEGGIQKLTVRKGASEPAAYAVVALKEYGFDPEGDEKVFYGVFDFGGGTTDFDFGIFREAQGTKERRYDYVIEHFGAGGDRYLGGENLLELLSFEVFKKNAYKLLENDIQFVLPPECEPFAGGESLLSHAREAKLNTKILMEKLRGYWESDQESRSEYDSGTLRVNLLDTHAKQLANFELDISTNELDAILYHRIEKGVENFFHSLRLAFSRQPSALNRIETTHIFLAGNSCKSLIVNEIFTKKIAQESEEIAKEIGTNGEYFKIYAPLQSDDVEKPNGKTGVAFGLIETRKGGDILVIDKNVDENISFKYYLGESRKRKFKVIVDRAVDYHQWIAFIDAGEDTFEVYYSSQSIVSTNRIPIEESGIRKLTVKIDTVDEDAMVYVRVVSPTKFEYVVAYEDAIENEEYLSSIHSIELEG